MAGGTAIERPERIKGAVHALIEDENGPIRRKIARSVDDVSARMPTPDEATSLRLPWETFLALVRTPGSHCQLDLRSAYCRIQAKRITSCFELNHSRGVEVYRNHC